MATRTRRGSGGKKKWGRNRDKCARYRAEGRREKNKARRIAKAERKRAAKAESQEAFFVGKPLIEGWGADS